MVDTDFEDYLRDHNQDGTSFSAEECADELGVLTVEASEMIQQYLSAQRAINSATTYVLYREPHTRTRNARWYVGHRIKDVRRLGETLYSDIRVKVLDAWERDVLRMSVLNPQVRRQVQAQAEAIVDGMLRALAGIVGVHFEEPHDDDGDGGEGGSPEGLF